MSTSLAVQSIKMLYTIRQYTEKDLNDLLSAWENASKVAHPFLTQEFLEKERFNIPNLYLPNADTWVAELNNTVVGFITLLGNEVGAIFVEPKFHGIGIGKALMEKAQEIHSNLEVEVFEANSIGRKFYCSYGFQLVSEKEHAETGQKLMRFKFNSK